MKKLQLTLIQIDNYGPWTVTPYPKGEAYLQSLQADLYSFLQKEFGRRGGLVFHLRFDNMLAISNGLGVEEHREIMEKVNAEFPVTVSMAIGTGSTAYQAQLEATLALQRSGSSRGSRSGVLTGTPVTSPDEDLVQISHMDLNHSSLLTDTLPIYDTHVLLQRAHISMMEKMSKRNALLFYMGGDNFMSVCNGFTEKDVLEILSEVKKELGLEFKAGVGIARNAERAAKLATEGLQDIRQGRALRVVVFKHEP